MSFWDKVKKDVQKSIKEGMDIVKEGAAVAKIKAGELTDEGKRRYNILALKTKVHKEISDLGGNIYDLRKTIKNPLSNSKVKAVIEKIEKLEEQIAKFEGKKKSPAQKKKVQSTKKKKTGTTKISKAKTGKA